jgi:hypothetical protein
VVTGRLRLLFGLHRSGACALQDVSHELSSFPSRAVLVTWKFCHSINISRLYRQRGPMRTGAIFVILFSAMATSHAAQPNADTEITLYCTGSTWSQVINQGESQTDAIVKFQNKAIYIEINAVGFGHSTTPPKVVTSMQVAGNITLSSAFQGRPDIKVGYSLNRYNGSLTVYPAEQNEKVLFNGTCKRATPLF